MKRLLLGIALVLSLGILVACQPAEEDPLKYTVTFDTGEGATAVDAQEILNGGKVIKPLDPEKDGFVFVKWVYQNIEWNFLIDIVTSNMTLTAEWLEISSTPTALGMSSESFTSVIVWQQTDADLQNFTVSIKPESSGTYTEIQGSLDINTEPLMQEVRFTPNVIPQGGYYYVKIEVSGETVESELLLFGGNGSENNPYLVSKNSDIISILEDESLSDQHFLQINDVMTNLAEPIEITNERKIEFSGTYDGGQFIISFTGNGGLFHQITAEGVVKNLVIDATTSLYAAESNVYPIGAVADQNFGLIENISSRALLENARLQGNLPVFSTVDTTDHTTGAGGIVGSNESTGIIRNVTVGGAGAVKAGRGIGGVAAYNFGLIEHASVTATLPAGNQANTANSSNTYSYGGGIAGFNFGTIQYASVTGRVFAQSAYAEAGNGNEGKNVAFGGIAGYNSGLITESSFARSLAAKEFIDKSRAGELGDLANNLGVASIHGDLYIGGIAGINAGQISNVYVGGALIAARDFAGGIAGMTLGNGSITNAYVFAEVAIKDNAGLKITTANAKTTVTTYDIAPSGFDANSVVFKRLLNSETDETWIPGQLAAPKLPEFTTTDLAAVGNRFNASGVLAWQQGAVTGVSIVLDTVVLPYGSTVQLEFSVTPSSAPDLYTTWTSSDETVVIIKGEGLIEGIGAGTATITVTTRDGSFTDTIVVTVEDYIHVDTVNVSSPEITLPAPNTITDRLPIEINTVINFVVELLPENAKYKNYTLTSSNSRAVVDGNQVTFVFGLTGPGNVSITISFEDSSLPSLEYRFLTEQTEEPADEPITSVSVTSPEFTIPEANNIDIRPEIEIGTIINLVIDILPIYATNKNYTITTSNSRATVDGHQISFVYGATGPGNVSVLITFEDTSVGVNGVLEYRFKTYQAIPITAVTVTSAEFTIPEANNIDIRPEIEIGTVINLVVDILPIDATNKNYTITTSNSRATVDGHQISFVYGLTGPGNVSVLVTFEDTSVGVNGVLEYRFKTVAAPVVITATFTSNEITLGTPNVITSKALIPINTTITFIVTFSPENPTNMNYSMVSSNGRATVNPDKTVTFNLSTGVGNVSITITFEDTTLGTQIFYFTTTNS